MTVQRGHKSPLEMSTPNHHRIATQNSLGSRYKPNSIVGTTVSHEEAWGADTERRRALLATEEASNRDLKHLGSIQLEMVFWSTGDDAMESSVTVSCGEIRELKVSIARVRW